MGISSSYLIGNCKPKGGLPWIEVTASLICKFSDKEYGLLEHMLEICNVKQYMSKNLVLIRYQQSIRSNCNCNWTTA